MNAGKGEAVAVYLLDMNRVLVGRLVHVCLMLAKSIQSAFTSIAGAGN